MIRLRAFQPKEKGNQSSQSLQIQVFTFEDAQGYESAEEKSSPIDHERSYQLCQLAKMI